MRTPDPAVAAALAADLAAAQYLPELDFLSGDARAGLEREQPALALAETAAAPSPAATLLRLFALGAPCSVPAANAALEHVGGVVAAATAGLVTFGPAGVKGTINIDPLRFGQEGLWFACDQGEVALGGPLPAQHVLGVGGASRTLADITIRARCESLLDLGTGCGIHAIIGTRHARTVMGTDISARALDFARFNAALNGTSLTWRRGDMLEPVAGERFDQIVANPPFVIEAPAAAQLQYRDGARAGDDLIAEVARGVIGHLNPGGVAQFLGNWVHQRGQAWGERWHNWIDEFDLDAWVIQREVVDVGQYVQTWMRDAGLVRAVNPVAFDELARAWVERLRAREVEAVGFGYVLLRAPGGPGQCTQADRLRRLEDLGGRLTFPLGPTLAAGLVAHDWLAAHHDLRGEVLRVAPDVTQESHFTPGMEHPRAIILRQQGGLGRAVQVSGEVAAVVGACDGDLPVGLLVNAVAELMGAAGLAAVALPALRQLVADGFLEPVNPAVA